MGKRFYHFKNQLEFSQNLASFGKLLAIFSHFSGFWVPAGLIFGFRFLWVSNFTKCLGSSLSGLIAKVRVFRFIENLGNRLLLPRYYWKRGSKPKPEKNCHLLLEVQYLWLIFHKKGTCIKINTCWPWATGKQSMIMS